MDQGKIGKFIAEQRKKNGLTQIQLAEKLNITDRAVSKWENGKAMPDSSIMLELCDALGVTVNDLLNAEIVSPENYNKKLEEKLLEITREKEQCDRKLMRFTILIAVLILGLYTIALVALWYSTLSDLWYIIVSLLAVILFSVGGIIVDKLDQQTGYYRCKTCGHAYIPGNKDFAFAFGLRYKNVSMRCPQCKRRRWHEKVYTKD